MTTDYTTILTPDEMQAVDKSTESRWQHNRRRNVEDTAISNSKSLKIDIDGMRAEFAASKTLGIPWTGGDLIKRRDLDDLIEVKSTKHSTGGLLVPEHQDPQAPYLLVYDDSPQYRLVGWAFGFEVQRDCYRRADVRKKHKSKLPPPFIRPASELHGIKSLVQWYINAKQEQLDLSEGKLSDEMSLL